MTVRFVIVLHQSQHFPHQHKHTHTHEYCSDHKTITIISHPIKENNTKNMKLLEILYKKIKSYLLYLFMQDSVVRRTDWYHIMLYFHRTTNSEMSIHIYWKLVKRWYNN